MKNKKLGFAKKDIKKGDRIEILIKNDGSLYSKEINCFESITIEDFMKLK